MLDDVCGRGPRDRARDHLVARPDTDREQRQVQGRRARCDGEDVLCVEIRRHPLLEQRRPRPRRQPTRSERLGDGRDLLLPDRGRLEAEPGATRGSHRQGSVRSPPHGGLGRGPRHGRSPVARIAPARSAPRRSGPKRQPGLPVGPHPGDALAGARLLDAFDRLAGCRPALRGRRCTPLRARSPLVPQCHKVLAEGERDREVVEVDAEGSATELGVVTAPEAGRNLDHVGAARRGRAGAGCSSGRSRSRGLRRPHVLPRPPHRSRGRSARREPARRRMPEDRRAACRSP